MLQTAAALLYSLGLLVTMLLAASAGRCLGLRRPPAELEASGSAGGLIDGAVFGLLGLLIAFTLSGALQRFDHRKELLLQESNAIGTAYLRLNLLPPAAQTALRGGLRDYVDARLAIYRNLDDATALQSARLSAARLQQAIWLQAVETCQAEGSAATTNLLLGALNEMFDSAGARMANMDLMHPPAILFAMLFLIAGLSAFLTGYGSISRQRKPGVHQTVFAVVIASTVYVILDIEYPRHGFIRVDAADRLLSELRAGIN